MFAKQVKQKIELTKATNNNDIQLQLKLMQDKDSTIFNFYTNLVILLKTNINLIEQDILPTKINKKSEVFICDTENFTDDFTVLQHAKNNDFFAFFSKKVANIHLEEFKLFLQSQGIKSLHIYFEHDGAGVKSWHSIYASI